MRKPLFKVPSVRHRFADLLREPHPSPDDLAPLPLLDPANSQRPSIVALLSEYESSSTLNFDALALLFSTASPLEFADLLRTLHFLSSLNPSIGRFLLTDETPNFLTQRSHFFFADCPNATLSLSLLSLLSAVLPSSPDLHSPLVLSAFYSFPHDVLHKIAGDVLCFSEVPDRPAFEERLVVACLSVVSAFFAFPCRLGASELSECLAAFHQNLGSSKRGIQREALNGLASFFRVNCGFAMSAFSIERVAEIVIGHLQNPDPAARVPALEIARAVAAFPDKRHARFLLDRHLLNFLRFDGQTVDSKIAGLSLLLAFLQHDGELVTIVLESAAAARAIRLLGDEPYAVRALAFRFCATVLRFPQSVSFVLQNGEALTVAMEYVEEANSEEVELFLMGVESLFFYGSGLGLWEGVRAAVEAAGIHEAVQVLLAREDLEWGGCNLEELFDALRM